MYLCGVTIEIIEAQACPDHIHMLISIPPKYSVSQIMGYLKGKSSLMIFDRHANLKYKYGNRHFWARGYFVDTVGRNKKAIKAYIQNQLEEDKMSDQISISPFRSARCRNGLKLFYGNHYAPLRLQDGLRPLSGQKVSMAQSYQGAATNPR